MPPVASRGSHRPPPVTEPPLGQRERFEAGWMAAFKAARAVLGDDMAAEGVAQDVCLRASRQHGCDRHGISAPEAYFARAGRHAAMNRRRRQEGNRLGRPTACEVVRDRAPTGFQTVARAQARRILLDLICMLPERSGQVMRLRLDGWSMPAIADELGVTVKTVEWHVTAGNGKLKQLMAKRYPGLGLRDFIEEDGLGGGGS